MASSLDITPALGHGIVAAQNLPGGYDAIDDRRQWSVGRMEGYARSGAYKVSQRSEGATRTVDVASNVGYYLVRGDDVAFQGLYLVPATPLKANLDVATPDATNPRIDLVVLEARDDAHRQDGITRARLYVLPGTPTSGATLANLAGAPTAPPSTAPLAAIRVAANAPSIATADIKDLRTSALLLTANGTAAGTGSVTTASVTTWASWGANGPSITFHEAGLYLVEASARVQPQGTGVSAGRFGVSLNGDNPLSTDGGIADFIASTAFDASTMEARRLVEANAGDVVSLKYATNNTTIQFGATGSLMLARPVG